MNVSVEKKKAEALGRMEALGFYLNAWELDKLGKIRVFTQNASQFIYAEGSELERLRAFEQEYNTFVFAVIRTFIADGMMDSYLFVSDYPEEWPDDRRLLKEGEATAYVYNHSAPCCSEVGRIGIKVFASSGLCRVW